MFFGWGVAVAITSVWVAPLLTARMRRTPVLQLVLPLLALDLLGLAAFIESVIGVIAGVVVGGLLLGVLNTVLTECVMDATDLPRSVASSAYSGVRFLGGAIAPPAATLLAATVSPSSPFIAGAIAVLVAAAIVVLGRSKLAAADGVAETAASEAEAIGIGDAA